MLSLFAAAVALLASGAEPGELVPVAYAARPLVQPHNTYEIFVEAPVMDADERGLVFGLTAGARHGFGPDLEIGVVVVPLTFYQGVSASPPTIFSTYRFVSGAFEMGAGLAVSFPIPIGSTWTFEASLPMLIHGGSVFRLDFGPRASVTTDAAYMKRILFPVRATLQILPELRIAATGGAESVLHNLRDVAFHLPAGGEIFYTVSGTLGAAVDVGATFSFPAIFDSSASPRVAFDRWMAMAAARFFVKAELNPLDEPF